MFRNAITIVLIYFVNLLKGQEYGTGLEFEDDRYLNQPKISTQIGGRTTPITVDLSIYAPIPGNQRQTQSSVGWALGYGALTIERAIQNGWTNQNLITQESSSAMFLYNQIKIGDCFRPSKITDGLNYLQDKGNCLAKYYDFHLNDCEQPVSSFLIEDAAKYKIYDYAALFDSSFEDIQKISQIKKVLALNKPVVIGMVIKKNFFKLYDEKFWDADLGDTTYAGGHAMVVIGYDDSLGAFRVFNSWGNEWGINGMIWIKYDVFAEYCKYGYIIYLDDKIDSSSLESDNQPSSISIASKQLLDEEALLGNPTREISGKFDFMRFINKFNNFGEPIFEKSTVSRVENIYHLVNREWQVGDKFQMEVIPEFTNGYIYVFSFDPTGKFEIHWPKNQLFNEKFKGQNQSGLSPFPGGVVKIPAINSVLKLSHPGIENLIILFSEKKIQPSFLKDLKEQLYSDENGDVYQSLSEILGTKQIPPSEIIFEKEDMQFKSITRSSGTIIPLIMKVIVN